MADRCGLISVREAGVAPTHPVMSAADTPSRHEPSSATRAQGADVQRMVTSRSCTPDTCQAMTMNSGTERYLTTKEPYTTEDVGTTLLPPTVVDSDRPVVRTSVDNAAPDGGWGWVVCTGAFFCNVIMDGMLFSFGVFYIELLADFGQSKGRTALVGSMLMGTHLFLGPVVSVMVNMWGIRPVTMAGGLIATLAFAVSTLAPNLTVLTFTYGVVGGLGVSMVYIPSIFIVGFYFDKRRALANGITSSGSGIGTFIYSPLCNYLQQKYTWRGSLLIMAALVLNCIAFGALYRPLHHSKKKCAPSVERPADSGTNCRTDVPVNCSSYTASAPFKSKSHHCLQLIGRSEMADTVAIRLPQKSGFYESDNNLDHHGLCKPPLYSAISLGDRTSVSTPNLQMRRRSSRLPVLCESSLTTKPLSRIDCFYSGSVYRLVGSNRGSHGSLQDGDDCAEQQTATKASRWREISATMHKLLSVSLLKNVVFIVLVLSSILWTTHSTVLTILPDHAIQHGSSDSQAALLISIIGIANTVGRVAVGWIADRPSIRAIWVNTTALLVGGVVCSAIAHTSSQTLLAVEAAIFGACMATWVSLRPIVIVEMLGIERLTNAFGLLAMFQGIAFSVGPPAAGLLYEHTRSYKGPFCLAGAAFLSSGIVLMVLNRFKRPETHDVNCSSDETTDSSEINN